MKNNLHLRNIDFPKPLIESKPMINWPFNILKNNTLWL